MEIRIYEKKINEPQLFETLCYNTYFIVASDADSPPSKWFIFMTIMPCERSEGDAMRHINAVHINDLSNASDCCRYFKPEMEVYVVDIVKMEVSPQW